MLNAFIFLFYKNVLLRKFLSEGKGTFELMSVLFHSRFENDLPRFYKQFIVETRELVTATNTKMVLINNDQCIIADIVSMVGFKIIELNHPTA